VNYQDIVERALWTFAQAFLGAAVIGDELSVEVGLVAGLAAAISVLKNALKPNQ